MTPPITRLACVLVLFAPACGGGGANGEPGDSHRADPAAAATAPDYEVHEWGLLRAVPGDTLEAGAIAPTPQPIAITIDKPVLYFHTAQPLTLSSIEVDAGRGSIVERWPPGPSDAAAHTITWRDVSVRPEGECALSPLPSASDPVCTALGPGAFCEVASLAAVRARGAACVVTPGGTDSMLFYRARTNAFTPPLRFEREGTGGGVRVTNEGQLPIPGALVRLRHVGNEVASLVLVPPAPGASVLAGADFAAATDRRGQGGSAGPGRDATRATLGGLGLDAAESAAFLRAWDPVLFGLAVTDEDQGDVDMPVQDVLTADETSIDELTDGDDGVFAPRDSFLYFLPEAACDGVASLRFDPAPRAVRRAMAVWSPLADSGSSH